MVRPWRMMLTVCVGSSARATASAPENGPTEGAEPLSHRTSSGKLAAAECEDADGGLEEEVGCLLVVTLSERTTRKSLGRSLFFFIDMYSRVSLTQLRIKAMRPHIINATTARMRRKVNVPGNMFQAMGTKMISRTTSRIMVSVFIVIILILVNDYIAVVGRFFCESVRAEK